MNSVANESITMNEFGQLAQSRSKFYGFLSGLYVQVPNDEFGANFLGDKLQALFPSISDSADVPADMKEGMRIIQAFVTDTKDRPEVKL